MERARSDWLLAMGFPQVEMQRTQGCVFVVTAAELKFMRPARLEDELDVHVDVEAVHRASMAFRQTIVRVADDTPLVVGRVKVACVTAESFRPTRIPESIRAATMAWMNSTHSQEQA
jgi:tol-pal system-associated acyl-CoA thioesterase